MIKSLRLDAKMQVPADYEQSFKQADETFLYQLVFDPLSENLVPLNELPEGLKPGDLQFAGPYPFLRFEIEWSLAPPQLCPGLRTIANCTASFHFLHRD